MAYISWIWCTEIYLRLWKGSEQQHKMDLEIGLLSLFLF